VIVLVDKRWPRGSSFGVGSFSFVTSPLGLVSLVGSVFNLALVMYFFGRILVFSGSWGGCFATSLALDSVSAVVSRLFLNLALPSMARLV